MEIEYKYQHLPQLGKLPLRQHIVVLSGAGMSAESGLSTFRDKDGLWKQYDWKRLASAAGFYEDPEAVLEFYNMRRKRLLEVEPNHAHRLIAELEKWHDVTIITQNVDNLHERAGSSNVIHLHGELAKVTSSDDRNNPDCIKELPLDIPIRIGDKAADGSQLRPYIVWFGEFVSDFEKAVKIVREADIFLVIGTSLTVQPTASLVCNAHSEVPKFIINPGEAYNPYDDDLLEGYVHIKEKASTGVETFIERLIDLTKMYYQ
jgi:NAD-dependent deacetylase